MLAVSVGSFTGVLVGFAVQSTINNAFAGMVVAIAHPFSIGDEITVLGVTGRVTEMGTLFTVIHAGSHIITVPNNQLLSQAIQRKIHRAAQDEAPLEN